MSINTILLKSKLNLIKLARQFTSSHPINHISELEYRRIFILVFLRRQIQTTDSFFEFYLQLSVGLYCVSECFLEGTHPLLQMSGWFLALADGLRVGEH